MNLSPPKEGLERFNERNRVKKYVALARTIRIVIVSQFLLLILIGGAHASPIDGSWIYLNSFGLINNNTLRMNQKAWFVQALHRRVMISSACILNLQPAPYKGSEVFSDAMRSEKKYSSIKDSIKEKSGISLDKTLYRYTVERDDCGQNIANLLVQGRKMVAVTSTFEFSTYTRGEVPADRSKMPGSTAETFSSLPFSPGNFSMLCDPLIRRVRGVPQSTRACAPLFFPYVAKKRGPSEFAKIVGRHHYIKGDPKYFNDYDDPFKNGLHPIYMVIPPKNNVYLVRVEDREGLADERDMYSGSYLTIKNGAVVDQLNNGCDMTAEYVCLNDRAEKVARMLPNGKFERF